jgi:hypothetical protein
MPPRIAHPSDVLVTNTLFGRCGTHSQKTFAQTVLAENSRTEHSLLGELKTGIKAKTYGTENTRYRKIVSAGAFDLRPLEVAEERAICEGLSARTV